ncbi:MAG: SDR family oxidoreductase [Desulfovibrio sp.]|jgi:3-oxoacyl-[acyl-carrier protein] reductase|nr:SDR family oxidoreductase [Desulfovibrio sp.]
MECVVISGATGGIGSHLALRALESGYGVIGLSRRPPEKDPGYPIHAVDVTDGAAVAAFYRSLRGRRVWALINAAGAASMNLLLTTPSATMSRLVGVNLLGAMHCCAEGAKLLVRRKGGRIINFSSIVTALGTPGESVYAACKAGVEVFSRCLAAELSFFNITVNTVAPPPIDTPMLAGLTREQIDKIVQRQIIKRQAVPEDVWNTVSFLLDEKSAMLTGEVLHIGGI